MKANYHYVKLVFLPKQYTSFFLSCRLKKKSSLGRYGPDVILEGSGDCTCTLVRCYVAEKNVPTSQAIADFLREILG